MGFWAGAKWVAGEAAGTSANRRFVGLIGGNQPKRSIIGPGPSGLRNQFLTSADAVVNRFGPIWARRRVRARSLGAWLLALLWILPPLAVFLAILGCHLMI